MLTKIYTEALLVDEEAADRVWESWWFGELDHSAATWAWIEIAGTAMGQYWANTYNDL